MNGIEHVRHRPDGTCVIRTGVPFGRYYEGSCSVGERWLQFHRRLPWIGGGILSVSYFLLRPYFGPLDGFVVLLVVAFGVSFVAEKLRFGALAEDAWRAAGDFLAQQRR
jgi:hypothetical protein